MVLSLEEFLRVVGLDPNPDFSKIANIASRGFLEAGIVLGFTIKLERFRIHKIGSACSTRFRTFKGGRQFPSSGASTTAKGASPFGLRSITFIAGWYNIEKGEKFSWKNTAVEESLTIPPGLYGFDRLQEVLKGASHTLTVCGENGLITLTVAPGWEILLSDGLLALLGLDDGLGGVWLDAGVYTGDRL